MLTEAKLALNLDCSDDINTMTINEEVQVIEWAPAVFHAIKKMDGRFFFIGMKDLSH